eukprot:14745672-Heterocapsa_arctica.AAC.1
MIGVTRRLQERDQHSSPRDGWHSSLDCKRVETGEVRASPRSTRQRYGMLADLMGIVLNDEKKEES